MSDQVQKPEIVEHPADRTCVLHRPSLERINALLEFLLDHSYNMHKNWREKFEEYLQIEQRRKSKMKTKANYENCSVFVRGTEINCPFCGVLVKDGQSHQCKTPGCITLKAGQRVRAAHAELFEAQSKQIEKLRALVNAWRGNKQDAAYCDTRSCWNCADELEAILPPVHGEPVQGEPVDAKERA